MRATDGGKPVASRAHDLNRNLINYLQISGTYFDSDPQVHAQAHPDDIPVVQI